MKAGFILGAVLFTTSMSAFALPSTDSPDAAAVPQAAHSVQMTLNDLGYSLDQNEARVIEVSSTHQDVSRQLSLDKPCEGYKAPYGCVITYNDGFSCKQYCGLVEELCDCVK